MDMAGNLLIQYDKKYRLTNQSQNEWRGFEKYMSTELGDFVELL